MPSNSVTITGNVTRDPELRFTPSGQATASFGVAVNRRWLNKQTQEWEEEVSFFDVVCWREMAENVSESLIRGARVLVTGRLDQRSWETPEGDKRSMVEIVPERSRQETLQRVRRNASPTNTRRTQLRSHSHLRPHCRRTSELRHSERHHRSA